MLKKLLWVNREDFVSLAGILGGLFLLIHAIISAVLLVMFPCDSIMISGMLLMVGGAVMAFIVTMGHVLTTFLQAVRFGQTRRRALAQITGLIGAETLFIIALAGILSWVEWNLLPRWWMLLTGADGYAITAGNGYPVVRVGGGSGVELWIDSFFSVDWWVVPLVIACGSVAGFIIGALLQRFGRMGGWLMWGVWMVFFIFFPRLPWRTHEVVNWLVPSIGTVVLTAFLWSIWSLLHAVVRE